MKWANEGERKNSRDILTASRMQYISKSVLSMLSLMVSWIHGSELASETDPP